MADPTTLDGRPTSGGPSQPVTVMNPGGAGGTAGTPSANVTSVQGVTGGTPLPASLSPATSGGLLMFRSISLLATGLVAKASAGQMYGYYIANLSSATRYIKVYDKATAADQTDTPVLTLPLPAGAAANVSHPNGVAFTNGIGVRATTGVADNDTGAPSANDVIVNLYYK